MHWRVTLPQLVIQAAAAEEAADAVSAVINSGQAPREKCRPPARLMAPSGRYQTS